MTAFRFLGSGLALAGLLLTGPLASAQTGSPVAAPSKTSPAAKTTMSERDAARPAQNKGVQASKTTTSSKTTAVGSMEKTAPLSEASSGSSKAGGMVSDQSGVMVGGATMLPSRDIVDNAALSRDHTTLVSAVKAADLAATLKGGGPFTVFAPTNEAFDRLPAGLTAKLMEPAQREQLKKILTYHVVAGRYTAADLMDGQQLTTVNGAKLMVMKRNGKTMLRDDAGHSATVTIPDVISSNGVTHVVNVVLTPDM